MTKYRYSWRQLSEGILEAAADATGNSVHAIKTNNPSADQARMIAIWLYIDNGFTTTYVSHVINRRTTDIEQMHRGACAALGNNLTWTRRLRDAQARLMLYLRNKKKMITNQLAS